jgi:hypothetical protein
MKPRMLWFCQSVAFAISAIVAPSYRIDGIARWTPWFGMATDGALGVTYYMLWRKGWMTTDGPLQVDAHR